MKLYEHLPRSVYASGRRYRVNLDFRNVLRMIEVLGQEGLLPAARDYLALKCVMRHPPWQAESVMAALRELLFPLQKKNGEQPRLTDFIQDADLIRAAFLQAYGINLWKDKLHWFEFTGLLACLPEGSRYSDVISIRARPVPAPTKYNQQERERLMKAKMAYALEMSDQERENNYQKSLTTIATAMLALTEKGGGQHGE